MELKEFGLPGGCASKILLCRSATVLYWRIQEGERQEREPRGLNPFIFMQFRQKNLQNNRLAHPLWELVPSQENSGSATVLCFYVETCCLKDNMFSSTC